MTWRLYFVFCLLPVSGYAYYDPLSPRTARVSYNESQDAKWFPVGDRSSPNFSINYFISKLNFDAISGKIVTGAADKLYLLNLDLQEEDKLVWPTNNSLYSRPSTSTKCQNPDSDRYACRNHIRVFQTMPDDDRLLFVCGTQSTRQPQCRTVNVTGGTFISASTPQNASDGLISLHPDLPGFGEFRNQSNEVDQDHTFFSANFFRMTNARDYRISYQDVRLRNTTDLSTAAQNITGQNITEQRPTEQDPLLMRDRFGDINGNNNWLRFPVTFVDYFRADYPVTPPTIPERYQFYFVFLRENLFDNSQAVDIIYSRVVRICRNDRGSTGAEMNGAQFRYFNSYMKARIFCEREVPSESSTQFVGAIDYQYNIIRSMAFNNRGGRFSEGGTWNWLMYGAFTGPLIGPIGSAICVYNANNTGDSNTRPGLFDVYRGDFADNGVVNDFVECDPNGRSAADAMNKVLIGDDITQIGEDPILAFDGFYVSQMVVDTICVVRSQNTSECLNQDVLFLGTSDGRILKVVFATNGTQTFPVFSEDIALDDDNAVNNLQLEMVKGSKYLFANTWTRIYRLPLNRCSRFSSCSDCIQSRDPYCVWNTQSSGMCELSNLNALAGEMGAVPGHFLQDIHTGNSSRCNMDTNTATPTFASPTPTMPPNVYFQIGLTRASCKDWINSSIANKTEAIVAEIVSAVNSLCRTPCGLTAAQIQNPGFRCGQDDNIVFRGELISTQQSSSRELRQYIQDWVRGAPEFVVLYIYLKVDPLCPAAIETLRDPACGEGSTPSTGAVAPVCDTGAIAAGWVFAILELIIIIIIVAIIVVRWFYLRSRKKCEINVELLRLQSTQSAQSTLANHATTNSENPGKLAKENQMREMEKENGIVQPSNEPDNQECKA